MTDIDFSQFLDVVRANSAQDVRRFLSAGADPNMRDLLSGYRPIHMAIMRGDLALTDLLVAAGADINAADNDVDQSPLCMAAASQNLDIVKYLLEAGAEFTEDEIDSGLLQVPSSVFEPRVMELILEHDNRRI